MTSSIRWRCAWRSPSIDRHHKVSGRGIFALAVAVLVHAVLLNSVLRHRPPPDAAARSMLWLKLAPPIAVRAPAIAPTPPEQPRRPSHKAPPAAVAARAPAPVIAMPEPQAVVAEAPARISAEQIMSAARRDLGKIDQELRKEHPQAYGAAVSSAQQRLEKGLDQAHEAAPNKWYQAAKVEDITPPGDDARKIYRITTARGTYCVRYADKNRKFDHGQANLGEPLIGACPHMF